VNFSSQHLLLLAAQLHLSLTRDLHHRDHPISTVICHLSAGVICHFHGVPPLLETNDIENVQNTDGTHEDHGNGEGQQARSSDDGWTLVRRGK
jgi:hypothetical protein